VDNYIVRLKNLSVSCEFPDNTAEDMIRDKVIEHCTSKELKIKFLRELDLHDIRQSSTYCPRNRTCELEIQQFTGKQHKLDYTY
jgi:hypothetical protein